MKLVGKWLTPLACIAVITWRNTPAVSRREPRSHKVLFVLHDQPAAIVHTVHMVHVAILLIVIEENSSIGPIIAEIESSYSANFVSF